MTYFLLDIRTIVVSLTVGNGHTFNTSYIGTSSLYANIKKWRFSFKKSEIYIVTGHSLNNRYKESQKCKNMILKIRI